MRDTMLVYIHALKSLAKIRSKLQANPVGVGDVDKVIDAVVREMADSEL